MAHLSAICSFKRVCTFKNKIAKKKLQRVAALFGFKIYCQNEFKDAKVVAQQKVTLVFFSQVFIHRSKTYVAL